jgi:subtilase family serine protease
VLAKSDWNDQVPEKIESNNVRATSAVKIGPDLTVSAVTAPSSTVAGGTINVSDTTVNQGGGAAAATATFFYLSTNTTLDANDVLLGSRTVPALASGTSLGGTTPLVVPAGSAGGTYYVIAYADGGKSLAETSETNNSRVSSSIKIGADLVVTLLTAPADAPIGGSISVTDTTKNQGAGPAGDSATGFYLSANSVLDAGDVFLGARTVGALAANASSSGTTALQIPAGTAAGSYYILAAADWAGVAPESVESNNTEVANIHIGPDLIVSALTVPSSSAAGAGISVSDTTKNQGPQATPATTTRFYLSTDRSVGAGDVLLGGRAVAALAARASSAGITAVVIPPQTVPGTYYLIAMADGDMAVAESVESNTRYLALTVTAP